MKHLSSVVFGFVIILGFAGGPGCQTDTRVKGRPCEVDSDCPANECPVGTIPTCTGTAEGEGCKCVSCLSHTDCSCDAGVPVCIAGSCSCKPAECENAFECNDENECTSDTCDPETAACVHSAVADGTVCTVETQAGTCMTGGCVPVPSECIGFGDDCTADQFYLGGTGCTSRSSAIASENVLSNPGFEGDAPSFGPVPDEAGFWQGDQSSQIGSNDGIDPVEGNFMVQCDATSPEGPTAGGTGCEILQAYEIPGDIKDRIAGGERLTARVTGFFNRVSGDASTDTAFGINLDAYDGDVMSFFTKYRDGQYLERDPARLASDPCVNTWESITAEVSLNQETPVDFLGITVVAIENINDDGEGVEFDGHYFDAVSLTLIPTPEL